MRSARIQDFDAILSAKPLLLLNHDANVTYWLEHVLNTCGISSPGGSQLPAEIWAMIFEYAAFQSKNYSLLEAVSSSTTQTHVTLYCKELFRSEIVDTAHCLLEFGEYMQFESFLWGDDDCFPARPENNGRLQHRARLERSKLRISGMRAVRFYNDVEQHGSRLSPLPLSFNLLIPDVLAYLSSRACLDCGNVRFICLKCSGTIRPYTPNGMCGDFIVCPLCVGHGMSMIHWRWLCRLKPRNAPVRQDIAARFETDDDECNMRIRRKFVEWDYEYVPVERRQKLVRKGRTNRTHQDVV